MHVPKRDRKHILAVSLAFVMVFAASTAIVLAAESKYAWGQPPVDVQTPKNPLPVNAVQNLVVISKGAADRTALHPVIPDPITVKSGSSITFVNQDFVAHTAIQGSPELGPTGFDSGIIGANKNATITVKGAPNQSIPYFCRIHPFLRGTIQIAAENNAGAAANNATSGATTASNQTGQQQQQEQKQAPPAPSVGSGNNTNSSRITTFTVGGTIASWSTASNNTGNVRSPELLSGRWSLQVVNGTAKSFDANITMVNSNGSGLHYHKLSSFRVTQANIATTLIHNNQTGAKVTSPLEIASPKSSLSIPGKIDIYVDGNKTWQNVSVNIMINQWHSLYIATDEGVTGNHFTEGHFPPGIYGIVDSIRDKDGKELFQNGKISLPGGG
jgi:plastocyanin